MKKEVIIKWNNSFSTGVASYSSLEYAKIYDESKLKDYQRSDEIIELKDSSMQIELRRLEQHHTTMYYQHKRALEEIKKKLR